jgi:probable rRNA maturation factor
LSIEVLNESDFSLDEMELVSCAKYVMGEMRVHPQADLCLKLVDEPAMEVLHVQWMDLPGPTDVMSFPMAKRQAVDAGHATEEELLLLLTHGILHLLGYDHAEPETEREMFELQRALLLTFLAGRGRRTGL